jgi:hypothetical protein
MIPSLNRGQWLSFPALFNWLDTGVIISWTTSSSSVLYVFFHWSVDEKSPFFCFPTIISFRLLDNSFKSYLCLLLPGWNRSSLFLKAWNFSDSYFPWWKYERYSEMKCRCLFFFLWNCTQSFSYQYVAAVFRGLLTFDGTVETLS